MKNLLIRTVSALVFAGLIVCATAFYPPLLPFIALTAIYFMLQEFYSITMGQSYVPQRRLFILTACLLFIGSYYIKNTGADSSILLFVPVPMMIAMISVIFHKDHSEFDKFAFLFAGLLYIGIPTGLLPYLLYGPDGEFRGILLLSLFIIIWCSDCGAYIIGCSFGQKENSAKLAPGISPKKSWWGFWGGLFFAALSSVILKITGMLELSVLESVLLGLVVSAAGVCGDLFESLWKRRFGVKDSGNIIPGHGGMLDRFDSSLFAIPAAAIYITILQMI